MINEKVLKNEEKITVSLRSLYSQYGYLSYKMSKFEEYDLYARNKDFLVSDRIITFTDTSGKLLALKPDVTLSIIKHASNEGETKKKVYYCENVYRASGSAKEIKEIMQTGLECVGDIDIFDEYEVVSLAAKSLGRISESYVIELSHMGLLNAIFEKIGGGEEFKAEILESIKKKSRHEAMAALEKHGSTEYMDLIAPLLSAGMAPDEAVSVLESLDVNAKFNSALGELTELISLLRDTAEYKNIRIDFSIVNDMNYYNGIVFNGYVEGVCECVLFGGRYDKLLQKIGKKQGGIGFAVYTDLLESFGSDKESYDVDTLILYGNDTEKMKVKLAAEKLISEGKSVRAEKAIPEELRYKELLKI